MGFVDSRNLGKPFLPTLALTLMVTSLRGKALCLLAQISTELVSAPSTSNSSESATISPSSLWGSFTYDVRTWGRG